MILTLAVVCVLVLGRGSTVGLLELKTASTCGQKQADESNGVDQNSKVVTCKTNSELKSPVELTENEESGEKS